LQNVRTEKELLIATKAYAREDRLRSWLALLSTLALQALAFAVCISELPLIVRALASVVSGLLIVRLFIFYHDFQHKAILTHSVPARWILDAYGMLVLSPPSVWNRSHDHHHKHNSKDLIRGMGSFPTMTCEQYASATFFEKCCYYWARHPLTILFGYFTVFAMGMCIRAIFVNPRQHKDACLALAIHIALITCLAWMGWDKLVLGMLVPLAIACSLGSYLFYAQHNFPGCWLDSREDWSHSSAALRSSSYLKMNPVMNWFTGNIGYHHIHHLNARIPFYRLPEAMAGLPELRKPASITLKPSDIVACFRSNLWDTDTKRLISYRAARQKTRSAFSA
jgi:omega-6 fatty acid desaturase (delta-12 desaturase)